MTTIDELVSCPGGNNKLRRINNFFLDETNGTRYKISVSGIPLFAEHMTNSDTVKQMEHYDSVAKQYVENLCYPHTKEYMAYLDDVFLSEVADPIGLSAEICCGHGELPSFFPSISGVGVDVSIRMLEAGISRNLNPNNFYFIQGDATNLPLQSTKFDSVFMFGGIHHVPDRLTLFKEVNRILKPGGKFYFREPCSDFFLWEMIRSVVYKISPALDDKTEKPLKWSETVPLLEANGFVVSTWKTYGFIGFCLFMNSDVLVFNRFFRYIPWIRAITRFFTRFDHFFHKMKPFKNYGLQVIGVAVKA